MSKSISSCGYLDYSSAKERANKARKGQGYTIGCNTWVRHNGDDVEVIYHNTAIITFESGGAIVLNTNGWTTPTTQFRFRSLLSCGNRLSSLAGRWTWDDVPFYDGMKVNWMGELLDPRPKSYLDAEAYAKRQIAEAIEGVDKLLADPVFYAKVRLGALQAKHTRALDTLLAGKLTPSTIQELALRNAPPYDMLVSVTRKRMEHLIRKGEL